MQKCIVEINSSTVGSTGRIMFMVADAARANGYTVYTCSAEHGNERRIEADNHIYVGNKYDKKIHLLLAKYSGFNGCFSHITTLLFLKKLERLHPDLIHIHNLHNGYVNLPMLFNFLKKSKIPVVWTLHDCWPYTGHCPYYDFVGCSRWITGCHDCKVYKAYPYSNRDNSKVMYKLKRKWFSSSNITIVTPSKWLGDEVGKSFLQDYRRRVINNGIDTTIFKPRSSCFKSIHGIEDKKIVLGVAGSWAKRKGLDVFVKLSEMLPMEYKIVIIGVNNEQKSELPKDIIAIERTDNQIQLAEIYSAAEVFVNPTREENFPTTNLEALACGTQVVTFLTGGSPEMLTSDTGIIVNKEDVEKLKEAICSIVKSDSSVKKCRERGLEYDCHLKYDEYVKLFDDILEEKL